MFRIGVDIGGTNIAAGIVDESYKIIKKCITFFRINIIYGFFY